MRDHSQKVKYRTIEEDTKYGLLPCTPLHSYGHIHNPTHKHTWASHPNKTQLLELCLWTHPFQNNTDINPGNTANEEVFLQNNPQHSKNTVHLPRPPPAGGGPLWLAGASQQVIHRVPSQPRIQPIATAYSKENQPPPSSSLSALCYKSFLWRWTKREVILPLANTCVPMHACMAKDESLNHRKTNSSILKRAKVWVDISPKNDVRKKGVCLYLLGKSTLWWNITSHQPQRL